MFHRVLCGKIEFFLSSFSVTKFWKPASAELRKRALFYQMSKAIHQEQESRGIFSRSSFCSLGVGVEIISIHLMTFVNVPYHS